MFAESVTSIPSIWSSMNSWFTPTVLFFLLNIMIGTILFISSSANQKHPQQQNPDHPILPKSPSVLQRLRSINNLHTSRSQDFNPNPNPNPDSESPKSESHQNSEQTHFSEDDSRSLDAVYHLHVKRSKSDTNPSSGELPVKLPAKIRKSTSAKSTFAHFEENEIVEARRPATVKEGRVSAEAVGDEQVDAKADDFINKFKQQLKLQRLDSIIRYKNMISSGGGK